MAKAKTSAQAAPKPAGFALPQKLRELLEEWDSATQFIYRVHYASALEQQRNHFVLGVPTVVLSAVVGSSVFASLGSDNMPLLLRIGVGLVSVLVTGLAALQTFLRNGERAEIHRSAGARFAALQKEVHQMLVTPPGSYEELKKWMDDFRIRWDALSADSPTASNSAWQKVVARTATPHSRRAAERLPTVEDTE